METYDSASPLQRTLVTIYRHRKLFFTIFALTFLVVMLFTFLMEPVFRAESKLLVSVNRAKLSVSPEPGSRMAPVSKVEEEDLNSVVSMLRGRELVREVLTNSGVGEDAVRDRGSAVGQIVRGLVRIPVVLVRSFYYGLHGRERPPRIEREVEAIAKRLEVTPVRRSNVIGIALEDADPEWASNFVNSLARTFLEHYARTFDPIQAEAFFDEQTGILEGQLAESERELKAYREKVGIVSLGQQRESIIGGLAAAEAGRDQVLVNLEASRVRLAALKRELPRQQPLIRTRRREVSDAANELKAKLLILEVERAKALENYLPTSQRLRQFDQQIATARSVLVAEKQSPTEEREYGINKTYEVLSLERALEAAKVSELTARLNALDGRLSEHRRRMLSLESNGTDMQRLERQVEVGRRAYSSYLQQREAARLAKALNQSQILNVGVVTPATPPVTPTRPRLRVNFMLALLLGLLLGTLAAFLRDHFDSSVNSTNDIRRNAEMDVLAVVPAP